MASLFPDLEAQYQAEVRLREARRRDVGFQYWWDLLDTNAGKAIDILRLRQMETFRVELSNVDYNVVDVLAAELIDRGLTLKPWTNVQIRKRRSGNEGEYWEGFGPWHLAFADASDAVVARMLLGELVK